MKTDDRSTRQRGEADSDEANVVRLSDWLAPDDELVPFGPRADAHAATRDPAEVHADPHSDAEPPAASGFWDGDTSVHTAVPGPGIFDQPGEPGDDHRRHLRSAFAWRPSLPQLHPFGWGSRARDGFADLVDWISWRWAAGVTAVALALIVLVITVSGSSSGRHDTAAQAGIGDPPPAALTGTGTLGEIGTSTRTAAVSDLRRLPPVDAGVGATGVASRQARALRVQHRRHAAVAASLPSSSTTGVTPTTTSAPAAAATTPAPAETEPVQTTSSPAPTTGGGGSSSSSSSGSSSSGSGPSSTSQTQSTFGAGGSLGPGSSPNG